MGFDQTANGEKWKVSEMGARNGSIDQAFGKQSNLMNKSALARAAASIFGSGDGGSDAPFRVKFLAPPPLSQPNMPVLQLRELSFGWPGKSRVSTACAHTTL